MYTASRVSPKRLLYIVPKAKFNMFIGFFSLTFISMCTVCKLLFLISIIDNDVFYFNEKTIDLKTQQYITHLA